MSAYRLPEQGLLTGVCAGLADQMHLSRWLVRGLTVLSAIMTGFFPLLGLYILLSCFLPVADLSAEAGGRRGSRIGRLDMVGLRRGFASLEQRTRELESYLVSAEYEWERRYRSLK